MPGQDAPAAAHARARLRWWREILYIALFYGIYSAVRNTQGSASVSAAEAFRNARTVIDIERALGLYHEETIQQLFLDQRWFLVFWNVFYGSFHFVVTAGVLIWLFRRHPTRYAFWRNTLAATTGLALVGFALFPLMPPRLLPAGYGYVDTLRDIGGLWSFDSGPMEKVSNQYAAMPSLHFGWSSWCALAAGGLVRRRWVRALLAAYPFLTLFAIVVTANHFWLDAVGGVAVLAAGMGVAWLLQRMRRSRPETEVVPGERVSVAS